MLFYIIIKKKKKKKKNYLLLTVVIAPKMFLLPAEALPEKRMRKNTESEILVPEA